MRSLCVVAALSILFPWSVAGCLKKAPEPAEVAQPPTVSPTEPPTPTPAAPEAAGKEAYAGAWGLVMGTIVLEADGTGRVEGGPPSDSASALTWQTEGDHIVITGLGDEMTARLSPEGGCLLLAPEGGEEAPVPLACVRLDPAVREQLTTAAQANAPSFERAQEKARQTSCLSNIMQLSLAVLMYTADYDEHYPRVGGSWRDLTYPYVKNEGRYACPQRHGAPELRLQQRAGGPASRGCAPAGFVRHAL